MNETVVYICGNTGSGKTTQQWELIKNLPKPYQVLYISPFKESQEKITKNIDFYSYPDEKIEEGLNKWLMAIEYRLFSYDFKKNNISTQNHLHLAIDDIDIVRKIVEDTTLWKKIENSFYMIRKLNCSFSATCRLSSPKPLVDESLYSVKCLYKD